MEADTRFVCARDLHEGIELRPGPRIPFSVVTEIAVDGSGDGGLEVTLASGRVFIYEPDDVVEVVG